MDIEPVKISEEKNESFQIEQLFGSKTRARLLITFLTHPKEQYYVRELSRLVGAQLNAVRRELQNLLDIGIIVERDGGDQEDGEDGRPENRRYYQANRLFPIFEDLSALMGKVGLLMDKVLVDSLAAAGDLRGLVLTGQFTGQNNIQTDVLIIGEFDKEALARAVKDFEIEIGKEVNYTLLSAAEFAYRKEVADRFLLAIINGKKMVLKDSVGL